MGLTTSNLDHSLVSERLQDLRGKNLFGASVTSSTESSRAIAEHITISGQVESVVSSTSDLLEVPHLLIDPTSILVDLLGL